MCGSKTYMTSKYSYEWFFIRDLIVDFLVTKIHKNVFAFSYLGRADKEGNLSCFDFLGCVK